MVCCDWWDIAKEENLEINGVCSYCGEDTINGRANTGCNYSPVVCDECGSAPCDGSC